MSWLYFPSLLDGIGGGGGTPGRNPLPSKIKPMSARRMKKPATQKNQL